MLPLVSCNINHTTFLIVLMATGHSILHKLTHLDSLAARAGLDPPTGGNDIGRHGTDDAKTACVAASKPYGFSIGLFRV